MKTKLSFVLAAGVAATLALAGSTASAADLRADIPFAFQMGGKTMPAGTYQVSTSQGVLGVRGYEGGVFVMTNRLEANGYLETVWQAPTLVFEKTGGDYVLIEVWTGSRNGRKLPAATQAANDEPWFGAVAQDVARVAVPLL